jgi:DNA-binding CsgD family transcriptional regulator
MHLVVDHYVEHVSEKNLKSSKSLTPRENKVIQMIAEGKTAKEMAN